MGTVTLFSALLLVHLCSTVLGASDVTCCTTCTCTTCGENAKCSMVGGRPECSCIEGYAGYPLSPCRAVCQTNEECEDHEACERGYCLDPCPGTCDLFDTYCEVEDHIPVCSSCVSSRHICPLVSFF